MLLFYMDQLRKPHNRELLELAVIFFGCTSTRGISFQYPGAMRNAR